MAVPRRASAGGITGLLELVAEHGEALEADLQQHYRLSLSDLTTGGLTWRRLRVLLAQLPRESRLLVALHGEAAMWSKDTAVLADIFDVLAQANWQRGANNKAPRPKPYPRPGSERDQQRISRQLAEFRRRHGAKGGEA